MIGMSTPYFSASARAAFAENTPSTTCPTSSIASEALAPFPIRMPARRFLECIEAQVTMRSPMPVSPAKVSGLPPIFTPSLVISAMPLVMSAALVLSPYPRPSAIPAARATTFFRAAPICMPSMSGLI